jgi:hypothetical protein
MYSGFFFFFFVNYIFAIYYPKEYFFLGAVGLYTINSDQRINFTGLMEYILSHDEYVATSF